MSTTPDEVSFFDFETNKCPYAAHQTLRDLAPVWLDPKTGMYVITRDEDVRNVIADTQLYSSSIGIASGRSERAMRATNPEQEAMMAEEAKKQEEIHNLYETKGYVPVRPLNALDAPQHMELRKMYNDAFKPARITALEPGMVELANRLIDGFISRGECDWVNEFAIPLTLYTLGRFIGFNQSEMDKVRVWTDAWLDRIGLMQSEEKRMNSVHMEIEAQQFMKQEFDKLRANPNDTVLSDIVNKEVPEWGRRLTDQELVSEVIASMWGGGFETTANVLSAGMAMLGKDPDLLKSLREDPKKRVPVFIEEVMRLESPLQSNLRQTTREVILHGVTIPEGGIINIRYGAANRDERTYGETANSVDLCRIKPKNHLTFSIGPHTCPGAALARRELFHGFMTVISRFDSIKLSTRNTFDYHPSYFLRAMKELWVEFTPVT